MVIQVITWIYFNPRSHTGSDSGFGFGILMLLTFQSTLPHGERLYVDEIIITVDDFNPRSHTGSDATTGTASQRNSHFNPRSHTGSDPIQTRPLDFVHFNPRSHTGSDQYHAD